MIYSPSNLARSAWLSHLSDSIAGFNAVYAANSSQYAAAQPITIDFNLATSKNLFMGRVNVKDIETAGVFQFPLMCIYATAGKNTNEQKFQTFSGPARVVAEVHLSGKKYKSAKMLHDFETWCDAVEHALLYIANNGKNQNWGSALSYTGDFGYDRPEIVRGGENWLQSLKVQLTFTVNLA